MKILVCGAGVLGSCLAHEWIAGGHQVTMLARGKRLEELQNNGLIIRHHLQHVTTVDHPLLTDAFAPDDMYDAVVAVMQKQQMELIIPTLAKNRQCGLFLLIGNNGEAEKTHTLFMSLCQRNPKVIFGFLAVGGRREEGKVICVHRKKVSLTVGSVPSGYDCSADLTPLFNKTNVLLKHARDMSAWLKYHIAIILPICYAIHWAKGSMLRLGLSRKMLPAGIQGMKEAVSVLEKLGIPNEPPTDSKELKNPPLKLLIFLRLICMLPMGKLMARDHAMSALDEMNELSREMTLLIKSAGIPTPALDELKLHLISD